VKPASDRAVAGSLNATLPNFLRHDGPAGTVVFLVALPLCLGIALASGAPLFAGIIAGVVGGMVVSVLSGSQVSVSGPAAGLAAIVAVAILDIGYPSFLLALVLAGALQFLLGVAKFGVMANYVPNSVIKGMLAGIGIVIILKQIPHALGRDTDFVGDFRFLQSGGNTTISDIADAVMSASTGAVIIATVSLALLIFWDKIAARARFLQLIPAPLAVVALGIAMNQAFGAWAPWLQLVEPEHLVNLPVAGSAAEFLQQFTLPNFQAIGNPKVWIAAATIAAVASLESLLSLEAADRLDPFKRISPPNRELRAQGIGNMVSGLIGGLPITTVAVRTSANVYAGARTWMSAFVHGAMLLAAVVLIPGLLKLTPLASLAAILIVVGFKLTKVSLYRAMYALGWDQFVPFVTTVAAVVFIDLLTGVLIGIVCGAFFVIRTNHHESITVVSQGRNHLMRFNKDASFVNKNEFRDKLREIPDGSHVLIDGSRALFIDHDILEAVTDFQELAPYKDIEIELKQWVSSKL
jgi:MFS superfamily sulfate permease-like transporter